MLRIIKPILLVLLICSAVDSAAAQVVRKSNKNQSLTIYAGPNQTIQLPATALLSGTVTPKPGTLVTSILWTVAVGPGTVTFSDPTKTSTTATFGNSGTFTLMMSVRTAKLSADSNVMVTVLPAAVIPPPPPPPPPPPVANNMGWDAVAPTPTTPVDGYNLYRTSGACSDLASFQKINTSVITATTYSDAAPQPVAYCYFVKAVNSAGESTDPSNVIFVAAKTGSNVQPGTAPSAPTGLTGVAALGSNSLTWNAVASNGYNLYRTDGGCDDPNTFVKRNTALITAASFIDNPSPAGAWCYFVRAVNGAGESAPSNIIWVPTKQ